MNMRYVICAAMALLFCLMIIGTFQPIGVAAHPMSVPVLAQSTPPPTPTVPRRYEPKNPLHAGDPAQYVFWSVPPVMVALIVGAVWWNRARRS